MIENIESLQAVIFDQMKAHEQYCVNRMIHDFEIEHRRKLDEMRNHEVQHRNRINYLHFEKRTINSEETKTFEDGIDSVIDFCESWIELINCLHIKQSQTQNKNPIVILVHIDSMMRHGTTMSEISSMIITLGKCLTAGNSYLAIGAVVDEVCTSGLIKQIREAGFSGLIPSYDVFGVEKTIEGVNALLNSKLYWPKDVVDVLSGVKIKSTKLTRMYALTFRQQEVYDLICKRGLSNKEIALILKITDTTVKVHVGEILKKRGLRTRAQLILAHSQDVTYD